MGLFTTDANQLNVYGYRFKWGSLHQTPEDLQHLMFSYDNVAADALDNIDVLAPSAPTKSQAISQETNETEDKKRYRDLYKLVQEYAETNESIGRLWTEINTIPDWVDWESIERGQKVFWRYGGPAITAVSPTFSLALLQG